MNQTETTKPNNGTLNMTLPMQQDEAEFQQTLPIGPWLLIKLEPAKKLSTILDGLEIRSPFAVVIAVGPEYRHDIKPGDRVTYAECVNMPKDMVESISWASKYKWLHENKTMGRLPRSGETTIPPTTPKVSALEVFFAKLNTIIDTTKSSGLVNAFMNGVLKMVLEKTGGEG